MELKKSPKADLENRKGLHLEIGLVVILAVVLVAFNFKSYDKEVKAVETRSEVFEIEDEVLQTQEEETPPPPPEETEVVVTDLQIVENDAEIENEVGLIDAGDNANQAQQEFTRVEVTEEEEAKE